jgi:hypothetical protein
MRDFFCHADEIPQVGTALPSKYISGAELNSVRSVEKYSIELVFRTALRAVKFEYVRRSSIFQHRPVTVLFQDALDCYRQLPRRCQAAFPRTDDAPSLYNCSAAAHNASSTEPEFGI